MGARTCLLVVSLVAAWTAFGATYVYDPNGRLVVVTNAAGESARYRYDKLGNLTQVERLAANALAIFGFSPGRGAPGVAVRIQGHGFSPTPSQNAVQFNGTSAVVTSATSATLTAVVPVGATTGPIAVTVGGQSVSSASRFVVDNDARPPLITNVSPIVASVGYAITVDGQALAPVAQQTTVRLNQRAVIPTTLSNTQAIFSIPTGAASGPVVVGTPYGVDVSDQDVVVVPAGVQPGDIEQVKRLSVDAPAETFAVSVGGRYAAALISATPGGYINAEFTDLGTASISYTFYGLDNRVLASGTATANHPIFLPPKLSDQATYLLLMRPTEGTASWKVGLRRDGTLLPTQAPLDLDGVPLTRFVLPIAAGQNLSVGLGGFAATDGPWSYHMLYLYRPDGTQLAYNHCYQYYGGCDLNLQNVPAGTYTAVIAPSGGRLSFKAAISTEQTDTVALDAPITMSLNRPGQTGRYRFAGTQGETLTLALNGLATLPANQVVDYAIYKPDGSVLETRAAANSTTFNLDNLPANGLYTLVVDPRSAATLEAEAVLLPGIVQELTPAGPVGAFTTQTAGQNIYFSFTAAAGQNLGLGLSELTSSVNAWTHATLAVYRPDGSQLVYENCFPAYGGCEVDLFNVGSGRHRVVISPYSGDLSFKAALSEDLTATLTTGTPYSLSLARPGQNGRLQFAATAGQTVAVGISAISALPAGQTINYAVHKPDGSVLEAKEVAHATAFNLDKLPVSGNYTLWIDPRYAATLEAQVAVLPGLTATVTPTTAVQSFATAMPGQNAYFSFTATAGQNLAFGITEFVSSENAWSYASLTVYRPDGSALAQEHCYAVYGGCDVDMPNLGAGTYRAVLAPSAGTMTFKAALSADLATTLAAGTPYTVSLLRPGQNGRLRFSGTAGQTVAAALYGLATAPAGQWVDYVLYKPDGSVFQTRSSTSATTFNLDKLPASGTYTLLVDPRYAATYDAQSILQAGITSTLTPTTATGSHATTVAGQAVYFSFTASAGQHLGVGLSDFASSEGAWGHATLTVYRPDGTQLAYDTCYPYYGGCELDLTNVGAGTYRVAVVPTAGTMSFKAAVSLDVATTLAVNTPYALSQTRPGQNGRLKFSGTSGQSLAIALSGLTTLPASQHVGYTLYKPDGSVLETRETPGAQTFNLDKLPVNGTYTLWIDPRFAATLEAQATLLTLATTTLTTGAASSTHSTQLPGQSSYFTFTGSAGQNLSIGLSELLTSDGEWTQTYLTVYRSDGSQLRYVDCFQYYRACDLDLPNLSAGTYRAVVTPRTGTISFKATLSEDITATLASGASYALALTRPGQNARLSFNGTAGQSVSLAMTGVVLSGPCYVPYSVISPSGEGLDWWPTSGDNTRTFTLAQSGTHVLMIDPECGATHSAQVMQTGATGSATQPPGASGPFVAVGGAGVPLSTTTSGQAVRFNFTATAGQNLSVALGNMTLSDGSTVYAYVYRPDGVQLAYAYCYNNAGCDFDLPNLPAGTYTVDVRPYSGTVSFTASVSADLVATLTAGTPYALALGRPGQNGRLRFNASAGQTWALQITGQTTSPTGRSVSYSVYKPDGTLLQSSYTSGSALTLNLVNLPAAGTYTVLADTDYEATVDAQVKLTTGAVSTLTTTGTPVSVVTSAHQQSAHLKFTASGGQNLTIGLSDVVSSDNTGIYAITYRPDGSQLHYTYCWTGVGCDIDLPNLPAGAYRVEIAPYSGTISFNATLSADLAATLSSGATYALALSRPGQNGRLKFSATAGQSYALQITDQTISPLHVVSYTIHKPDGSVFQSASTTGNGLTVNLLNVPVSGNYTAVIDTDYAATVNAQVKLIPAAVGTLTTTGTPANFATTASRQAVQLKFTASAGQNLALGLSDVVSTGTVYAYVYRPDGTQHSYAYCWTGYGCDLDLPNLPAGTYRVEVAPTEGVMSFTATLSSDVVGTLAMDTPYALSLSRNGQNARLTFNGNAGQALALGVADQVFTPAGYPIYYHVYKPDGSLLQTASTYDSRMTVNLVSLPVSGTYTVVIDTHNAATVSAQLKLTAGATSMLTTAGAPTSFATTSHQQYVRLKFTATAGQNLSLALADVITSDPSNTYVHVLRPDGTEAIFFNCSYSGPSCDIDMVNLPAGTYTAEVRPYSGTLSFTATLSGNVVGALTPDTPHIVLLDRRGQDARLVFDGVANQRTLLNLEGFATTPAGKVIQYTIFKPDGSQLASGELANSSGQVAVRPLATGRHTLYLDPKEAATASGQITLH